MLTTHFSTSKPKILPHNFERTISLDLQGFYLITRTLPHYKDITLRSWGGMLECVAFNGP